jgi:hypothetical protein
MLRKLLSVITVLIASASFVLAQNESAIKVKLIDKGNKETIPFANVVVEMGGIQVGVGTTNIDGEVMIKPLNPGKYNVKASYVGYQTVVVEGINLAVGKTVYQTLELTAGQELEVIDVIVYTEPLIDPDTKSGSTVTREEYQNMASKNINSVAATTAGIYQQDEGGALNVRGQRSSGTTYFIDGVRVTGSAGVAQSSVEQVTTIIGGTPAEYGDATGGIIAITTRGPASSYMGSLEVISSGLGEKNLKSRGLDAYGYNFVGFSFGGPILTQKDTVNNIKKPILGFLVSGELYTEKDPDPSAVGFYQVKADKLAELEQNPLRPDPKGTGGYVLNSEFLTMNDLEKIKAKNNVRSNTMRLNGKVQYQPTANMGITLGGSLDYNQNHNFVYEYALFNHVNNPLVTASTWRTFAKLTQKFNSATAQEEEKSSSNIKNAYFTIQASFAKTNNRTEDDTHKDRLFDYGYIGKFNQKISNTYSFKKEDRYDVDGDGIIDTLWASFHDGFRKESLTYVPGELNPTGTAYTTQYFNDTDPSAISSLDDVQAGFALRNGDVARNVYSMWYNTGRQYRGYAKSETTQSRVFANFSADIKKHAIQMGFEFEQRVQRSFSVTTMSEIGGLWGRMRQLTNSHIEQLDSMPMLNMTLSTNGDVYYDFNRLNDGSQTQFDRSLREKLGLNVDGTDWIDIDSYDPSMYNLEMFSADDLLNNGTSPLVAYYGYTHDGKKLGGNPTLDDFFTQKDENGNFKREIGAYRPIYIAGYIQDRFDFRDLKFNIGLRVDRFDANQQVLKDKYLLYEAKTAGEVDFASEFNMTRPSNIGDDFVVYVDNKDNPTKAVGFRDGNTWYNAAGTVVTDPNASLASGVTVNSEINPYLVDPAAANRKELSSKVFTDYTPQVSVAPRIAFSFPISDVANFFAHYDVLTQRPSDLVRLDPMDYFTIQNNSGAFVNNPNLKPERTTDYELGFSQVLNERKNSAITISAFYRELRNMIQGVQVYKAFPVTYNTFDNIDFGTVKGFSLAYDLRRMANGVQLTTNYTLQFADGTGSSSTDGVNLAASGQPNLRTTHPLDYDQRHTVVLNIDYRFGAAQDYSGPVITLHKGTEKEKNVKVFENVGANLVARAGSGTPYSRQRNITQGDPNSQNVVFGVAQRSNLAGMVNGSSLPWNFKFDLRVDKDIELVWKKDGDNPKRSNLNIYLQVLNLLNTRNIINVYKATGSPDDDGYIASPQGQLDLVNQTNTQSYLDLYSIKMNDPSYYSRPRVIRLGLLFDF